MTFFATTFCENTELAEQIGYAFFSNWDRGKGNGYFSHVNMTLVSFSAG